MKKSIRALLGITLTTLITFGVFHFAINLRESVKETKELEELQKEKLRLEIKIKRIQLGYE